MSHQINVHDPVPLFQRKLVNVDPMLRGVDAGVVHQDVETPKLLHQFRQGRLHALFIADIYFEGKRACELAGSFLTPVKLMSA